MSHHELEHGENCTCCPVEVDPIGGGHLAAFHAGELNAITDVVLAYRPKPKTKAAKRRIRRKKRAAKKR